MNTPSEGNCAHLELKETIERFESFIKNPTKGLPEEVFLFISRNTPLVNVDLLIKDEDNQTLLIWRDDGFDPPGWHIPGGIIRFRETFADRLNAVAQRELGAQVSFRKDPLAVNEFIHPTRNARGHFISFLYACTLIGSPNDELKYESGRPGAGQWAWHRGCPPDLMSVHGKYRDFF